MSGVRIRLSGISDIPQITGLIKREAEASGALLPVPEETLRKWIKSGFSYVAVDNGTVVGHEAAHFWPVCKWVELRSLAVKPEYRGMKIGSSLSLKLLSKIGKTYKGCTVVAFTNKAGSGKGILKANGFVETGINGVPAELFTIGSKNRGKSEFGYKIFVRKPSDS